MKREDVLAYIQRDWALVREMKDRYWEERKQSMTPEESLALGDSLRQHVQALRPDWPTEEDRQADLEVHIRVSGLLRRVPTPSTLRIRNPKGV